MTDTEATRRRYLASVGAAGGIGLAGCVGPFWDSSGGSAVIREYWDAIDNGEFERANGLLHPNQEMRNVDPIQLPGDVAEDEVAESEIMDTFTYGIDEEIGTVEEDHRSVMTLQVSVADERRGLERTVVLDAQSRLTTDFEQWRYFAHAALEAEELEDMGLAEFAGNSVADLRFLSPDADFESEDETISHVGGDALLAGELFISGEGVLIDGEPLEEFEKLTWVEAGGAASGEIRGEPAVQEGDTLTLAVDEDALARFVTMVWESADDPRSQNLVDVQL